jgi:hypothetical protein
VSVLQARGRTATVCQEEGGGMMCDWFGWFCADHGEYVTHAAPEIHSGVLVSALVLVVGLLLVVMDHERGRR